MEVINQAPENPAPLTLPSPPGRWGRGEGEGAESAPSPLGELVVQNGRFSGTRRALTSPLTLIGRDAACEVRLNVEGVNPFHCALASGPAGIFVRDFQDSGATLVNGQAVTACALQDGDLLAVGPFHFQVRLPAPVPLCEPEALQREKEALRIQAAAVAAQQAALTEDEIRLQQRSLALEQEEQQLATHLEEKARRLLALRDQVRQAHANMCTERAAYERRVAEVLANLEKSRKEVSEGFREAQAQRQRLGKLQRRLKQRWHRHWANERETMRRREAELVKGGRALEAERERLRQEKSLFTQTHLRVSGEAELGRRQLQAEWTKLRHEQSQLEERRRSLEEREADLVGAQQALAVEQQRWQALRLQQNQEMEGLESRIRNYRRKILDREQEVNRLEAVTRALPESRVEKTQAAVAAAPALALVAPSAAGAVLADVEQREWKVRQAEAELQSRMAALEEVAAELADQRLLLMEECERLAHARQGWQREYDAAAADLEVLGLRLQEREQFLNKREQALDQAESDGPSRPLTQAA